MKTLFEFFSSEFAIPKYCQKIFNLAFVEVIVFTKSIIGSENLQLTFGIINPEEVLKGM